MTRPTPVTTDHVLPRQLREGLAPEVLAVPAPPVPPLDGSFRLRTVDPDSADTELIAEWMRMPRLIAGWEQDWPTERWYRHLKAQTDGSYSRPVLCVFRDKPIGYLEIYRAAQDSIAPRYAADPFDLGIHAAIADEAMARRGFGPLLLPRIVSALFELESDCRRIMFDPDHRNIEARRLCEHAGCAFLGEHQMTNRKMALYVLPRTPADIPGHRPE
ncbi:GNAT family N-acetyltransferase [Nocardia aurantia]|uniref:Lysine N-acyltransferase MbtK n=1 Tax=Nocardia aurantia TaxID=2585199 RepID=A0A7K0DI05_9NOCA|nr:GNAT family N-acetyltransferase [Nocardia aurantia]MQY24922.1 Lysine N-acyltransferase MbtK [Nocardia aurantia]